jgi:hypothetical protein
LTDKDLEKLDSSQQEDFIKGSGLCAGGLPEFEKEF